MSFFGYGKVIQQPVLWRKLETPISSGQWVESFCLSDDPPHVDPLAARPVRCPARNAATPTDKATTTLIRHSPPPATSEAPTEADAAAGVTGAHMSSRGFAPAFRRGKRYEKR